MLFIIHKNAHLFLLSRERQPLSRWNSGFSVRKEVNFEEFTLLLLEWVGVGSRWVEVRVQKTLYRTLWAPRGQYNYIQQSYSNCCTHKKQNRRATHTHSERTAGEEYSRLGVG